MTMIIVILTSAGALGPRREPPWGGAWGTAWGPCSVPPWEPDHYHNQCHQHQCSSSSTLVIITHTTVRILLGTVITTPLTLTTSHPPHPLTCVGSWEGTTVGPCEGTMVGASVGT
jgi:hypothetical protein